MVPLAQSSRRYNYRDCLGMTKGGLHIMQMEEFGKSLLFVKFSANVLRRPLYPQLLATVDVPVGQRGFWITEFSDH